MRSAGLRLRPLVLQIIGHSAIDQIAASICEERSVSLLHMTDQTRFRQPHLAAQGALKHPAAGMRLRMHTQIVRTRKASVTSHTGVGSRHSIRCRTQCIAIIGFLPEIVFVLKVLREIRQGVVRPGANRTLGGVLLNDRFVSLRNVLDEGGRIPDAAGAQSALDRVFVEVRVYVIGETGDVLEVGRGTHVALEMIHIVGVWCGTRRWYYALCKRWDPRQYPGAMSRISGIRRQELTRRKLTKRIQKH